MKKSKSNMRKNKWKMEIKRKQLVLSLVVSGVMILGSTIRLQAEEYEYDVLNRITRVTYVDGSYVEYAYDSNGNILNVNVYDAQTGETSEEEGSGETSSDSSMEENDENALSGDEDPSGTAGEESESGFSGEEDVEENDETESAENGDDVVKSEVRKVIEKVSEAVKEIVDTITRWVKSWF